MTDVLYIEDELPLPSFADVFGDWISSLHPNASNNEERPMKKRRKQNNSSSSSRKAIKERSNKNSKDNEPTESDTEGIPDDPKDETTGYALTGITKLSV